METSHLTAKQAWYQRNRTKVIEKARQWRLDHLDRFREIQREAKRRNRKQLPPKIEVKQAKNPWDTTIAAVFTPAPGFDPTFDGPYDMWCLKRGIDPNQSWG